jgi:hypothetical protein
LRIPSIDGLVELRQQVKTFGRYPAENSTTILGAGGARYQTFSLETIDETCNTRSMLYHPFADGKRGQAVWSRSTQNSQHVVLLRGNAVWLDHLCQTTLHGVSRAKKAERGLLLARAEIVGWVLIGSHWLTLFTAGTLSKQMVALAPDCWQTAGFGGVKARLSP